MATDPEWRQLILENFNLDILKASEEDYNFLQEISNISIGSPISHELIHSEPDVINDVISRLASEEIKSWLEGNFLRYYTFNPLFFMWKVEEDEEDEKIYDPYEGVFVVAHSLDGAILRIHQYSLERGLPSFLRKEFTEWISNDDPNLEDDKEEVATQFYYYLIDQYSMKKDKESLWLFFVSFPQVVPYPPSLIRCEEL